jgi:hypothetical protein
MPLCVAQLGIRRPVKSRVNQLPESCISGGPIAMGMKCEGVMYHGSGQLLLLLSAPCPAGCRYPSWFLSHLSLIRGFVHGKCR